MPKTKDLYSEASNGLEIYFATSQLSLGDIGIVSSSIDYMLNKAAIIMAGFPFIDRALFDDFYVSRWAPYPHSYPVLVSADITDLRFESFSAKTRVRLHRALRDYGINITSGLIVAAILAAFVANQEGGTKTERSRPDRFPDLGPNITVMTENLSASGKPWELRIRDSQTGAEVVIKGNQASEPDANPQAQ